MAEADGESTLNQSRRNSAASWSAASQHRGVVARLRGRRGGRRVFDLQVEALFHSASESTDRWPQAPFRPIPALPDDQVSLTVLPHLATMPPISLETVQQHLYTRMNEAGTVTKNTLNSEAEIRGTLKFAGELTFEGKLEGEIVSEGTLHLGDTAAIKGDISVGSVVVRGKIQGNVTARDKIEIKAKTELFGDIKASKLVVEEGVTFVGKSEVNPNKATPTPPPVPRPADRPPEPARPPEQGRPGR